MKNLLYILLFVPLLGYCQLTPKFQYDSSQTAQIQNEIINNLDNHHKQFKNGMYFQASGLLLSIASNLVEDNKLKNSFAIAGTSLNLLGIFNILDSQKWFSKNNYSSFYSDEFNPKSNEINIKNGSISLNDVNSIFNEKDLVEVQTIHGSVVMTGEIKTIAYNRIEIESDDRIFTFYLSELVFIRRVKK
jgi:hypothetical protein